MTPPTYTRCLIALSLMERDYQDKLSMMKAVSPLDSQMARLRVELEETQQALTELNEQELQK